MNNATQNAITNNINNAADFFAYACGTLRFDPSVVYADEATRATLRRIAASTEQEWHVTYRMRALQIIEAYEALSRESARLA